MADGTARSSGGGNSLKPSHNHGLRLFLRRLAAFTLAEVLITLGIIGVVAAMTMPSLITNYQKKQTVTQLKKAYTELSQVIKSAEQENGMIETWDVSSMLKGQEGADRFANEFLIPYIMLG